MPPARSAKGKKRVHDSVSESEDLNAPSTSARHAEAAAKVKKSKRAVTKKCPVCDEEIPVRLLERHADLEAERLDEIMAAIGSVDILDIAEPDDGQTARTRKSAVKARQNMQPRHRYSTLHSDAATLELLDKSVRLIKRRRKQRYAKLRDMSREDEDGGGLSGGSGRWAGNGEGTSCPVCLKIIPGDPDVVEAHVDACLAHETRLQEEREQQERLREESPWEEIDIDGDIRIRATDGASLRGMGFAVRDPLQQDIDDDVDIDGDDDVAYGAPQFGRGDVVNPLSSPDEDEDVDIDGGLGESESSNHTLVVGPSEMPKEETSPEETFAGLNHLKQAVDDISWKGELDVLNEAVNRASRSGDLHALTEALQNKMKLLESTKFSATAPFLCRICLDPYTESTVSTGCWHTCCKECWLRCLGSTKLCPICKRITTASELRRVYI